MLDRFGVLSLEGEKSRKETLVYALVFDEGHFTRGHVEALLLGLRERRAVVDFEFGIVDEGVRGVIVIRHGRSFL